MPTSFSVVPGSWRQALAAPWHHLAQTRRYNLETLRRAPLAEISGALGDLGTLLPLMTALALKGSISLSSTLVFSGLANIASGFWFGIPLPVQPMKAIAASAIASEASLRDTVAAGALVSSAVLFLAVTGLMRRLADVIPVPVVKGIQLGAGLSLVISAGGNSLLGGDLGWLHHPLDNRIWALAAFIGLLVTQRMHVPRENADVGARGHASLFLPYALVVFAVGLVLSCFIAISRGNDHVHWLPHLRLWQPHLVLPNWLSSDAWSMAVAQLPLTTLNSVIAVSALADELFGPASSFSSFLSSLGQTSASPTLVTSVTAFGCSVGAMNLIGCWFGAMPVCHGAGGLAAQYRFGARSGSSVAMLGASKVLLGLFLGNTLVDLLRAFPRSLLGVLVLAAGLELATAGASLNEGHDYTAQERKERWTVMLMTAACLLAFKNDAVGFLAGLLCYGAYRVADWLEARHNIPSHLHRHSSGESQALLS